PATSATGTWPARDSCWRTAITGPRSMMPGMSTMGKSTIMYRVRLSRTLSSSSRRHTARILNHTGGHPRGPPRHPRGKGVLQRRRAHGAAHLRRGAQGADFPVHNDRDPVAHPVGFQQIMAGKQHAAAGLTDFPDNIAEGPGREDIQPRGGLI